MGILRLGISAVPGAKQLVRLQEGQLFSSVTLLVSEVISCLALLAAGLVMARIEGKSIFTYGFALRRDLGLRLVEGAAWGFVFVTALYALLAVEGGFLVQGFETGGALLLSSAGLWAVACLGVGLAEEFSFRGYGQHTLAGGIGFWPAAVILSFVFGVLHLANPGEGWAGAASAAVFGLFFCFSLKRTGTLWLAMGMHAAFDFGETFLFAGSTGLLATKRHLLESAVHGPAWLTGGSVGPEAGVNGLVLFPLLFLAFHLTHPEQAETPS